MTEGNLKYLRKTAKLQQNVLLPWQRKYLTTCLLFRYPHY